ncbi:MAG: hypothetical protein IPL78_20610 [Chloroflexi bacterium]|nr:hypothetical protein [Chloroflexota bacterium]
MTVTVQELNAGEYCTNAGVGSVPYARRCFEITPTNNLPATVRLYGRTADELNDRSLPIWPCSEGMVLHLTELTGMPATAMMGVVTVTLRRIHRGFPVSCWDKRGQPHSHHGAKYGEQMNQPTYLALILLLLVLLAITIKVVWRRIV